jgi:glycosyltransferase involved in cell wall biosynthesis
MVIPAIFILVSINMKRKKIIRITTVPESLRVLLKGQLRYMNQYFDIIGIANGSDVLEDVKDTENVRVIALNMTRMITPFKDLLAVWRLYRILKVEKPEIVHSHTPKAGIIGMVAAKLAGVRHRLHTVAGMPLLVAKGKKRVMLDIVEKITYACATKVYPNSYGLLNIIVSNNYTKKEKLEVIGNGSSNGIDTSYFNPSLYNVQSRQDLREKLNINDKEKVFLFVGRLVKDKGVKELVEAFCELQALYSNIKLVMLGNFERHLDPLDSGTESVIASNPNIIHLGYIEDVRPYFYMADYFTFPSYREGLPNVVLQAGAMSIPSIVTDINGSNEIIKDGINGTIVPVKDSKSLFFAMKRFVEDSSFLLKIKENSREMIVERYDRQFLWESLLREYESLS